ncbi:MAG: PQQ-dependent sugar dehydrogenase [Balneolaceae bacterium]
MATACNGPAADSERDGSEVNSSIHHEFRVVTVVDSLLQHPWGLAFLPDGDMLVTERGSPGNDGQPGQLRIIRDGELLSDPVPGLPEIRVGGQGGLLDVVLHPDFETNRLVYLSYAKPGSDDSQGTTAVIRGRFESDALHDVEEVFEAEAWRGGRGHHGSRIVFDDDGYMFISIGDRQVSPGGGLDAQREHPAQDLSNHIGTIVRLNDDGSVPDDNPFTEEEGVLPEIWSYGHRNPQGLTVHPETNEIWAIEHGPQGGDELNHIRPGLNYGWPVIGYGVNYGPGSPIHEVVHHQGMEYPIHHWTPSIAPSGLMIYTGDKFPQWHGNIFVGGMSDQHQTLARVVVDGDRFVSEELLLKGEYRIRDVRQGPDGYIYLGIDDRSGNLTSVLRLEPS